MILHLKTAVSPPPRWQMMMDTEGYFMSTWNMDGFGSSSLPARSLHAAGEKIGAEAGVFRWTGDKARFAYDIKQSAGLLLRANLSSYCQRISQFSCLWHWRPVVFVNDSWRGRCFLGNKPSCKGWACLWEYDMLFSYWEQQGYLQPVFLDPQTCWMCVLWWKHFFRSINSIIVSLWDVQM